MLGRTQLRKLSRSGAWPATARAAFGCAGNQPAIRYIGEGDNRYYRAQAIEIDYPLVADQPPHALNSSTAPRTIRDRERTEIRDMTLAEAIQIALQNSDI